MKKVKKSSFSLTLSQNLIMQDGQKAIYRLSIPLSWNKLIKRTCQMIDIPVLIVFKDHTRVEAK
ncbi:hypothetical protein BLL40_16040 [Domibacillus mangrovi]|uniref:Uncharacterized protein n=1 Tax=Domibacillus mangrovi TaxID=1714354 RepID=A0A1Q5NZ83_9BACI|nr:hypothetical protein BLL40_16040 [Domibacillus mangrovi]